MAAIQPALTIPAAMRSGQEIERRKIISLIKRVEKCWPDNELVTSVLRSLIWEIENPEELV